MEVEVDLLLPEPDDHGEDAKVCPERPFAGLRARGKDWPQEEVLALTDGSHWWSQVQI